jgi:hypothetical protein
MIRHMTADSSMMSALTHVLTHKVLFHSIYFYSIPFTSILFYSIPFKSNFSIHGISSYSNSMLQTFYFIHFHFLIAWLSNLLSYLVTVTGHTDPEPIT